MVYNLESNKTASPGEYHEKKAYFWIFLLLTAVYICLAFGLPIDPETIKRYQVSETELRLLNLTIIAPLIIIYFSALYGFHAFRSYAEQIEGSRENKPFMQLATGLGVLAFGLPISGIVGSLNNFVALEHTQFTEEAMIVKNYTSLAIAFVALILLARGAESLLTTLKTRPKPNKLFKRTALHGLIVLSCVFTWLITTHPAGASGEDTYYLPNWLIILTLAVPYLYAWCRGVQAAHNLALYRGKVKGNIYRNAINSLSRGIGTIIILSVFLQLLITTSARLVRLNLTPVLLLVYLLIAMYAIGYGLVARGAKKLTQIEKV